jgi:hypothetical protein
MRSAKERVQFDSLLVPLRRPRGAQYQQFIDLAQRAGDVLINLQQRCSSPGRPSRALGNRMRWTQAQSLPPPSRCATPTSTVPCWSCGSRRSDRAWRPVPSAAWCRRRSAHAHKCSRGLSPCTQVAVVIDAASKLGRSSTWTEFLHAGQLTSKPSDAGSARALLMRIVEAVFVSVYRILSISDFPYGSRK